jgi:putative PIN family toxin of toxin-antitoxin system
MQKGLISSKNCKIVTVKWAQNHRSRCDPFSPPTPFPPSLEIIKEVSRVRNYPRIKERFKSRQENVRRFFRLIFRKAIISMDIYQTDKIVDDPTDNKFLACALEKKADYIVSRDPHLRNLKHFHGVQIIDATTFIEKVKGK